MDHFNAPPIGLALRRLRKKHRLTQKDLANGICSQAEISKIENGTHSPTVDLLFALSRKMQVPVSSFLDHTNYRESLRNLDDRLLVHFRNGDFQSVYNDAHRLIENQNLDAELSLLIQYYYNLSAYRLGKLDYRNCIVILQQLSNQYSTQYYSPNMIIRIKSAIAILHFENKSYKRSHHVYEELLELDFDGEELSIERVRIQYNFSKILLKLNKVERALEIVENGIEQSLHHKDMSLLGQLFYQKGECQELLKHEFSSIAKSYRNAYFLFDLMGIAEYSHILLDHKSFFLGEIAASE